MKRILIIDDARDRAAWLKASLELAGFDVVGQNPNTTRALVMAMLDAAKFIDAQANRAKVAELIARPDYVDAPADNFDRVIDGNCLGNYEDGLGKTWHDPNH